MRKSQFDRRALLFAGAAVAVGGGLAAARGAVPRRAAADPVRFTPAQWRARLSPSAYSVLRDAQTETPYTSALLDEHRRGDFTCAGCKLAVFSSATKFDSGTGWPSFYAPLPHAVATANDLSMIVPRTEVHCSRCGGHLGHVFDDGPQPTGLRYCMNGVAMGFQAA